MIFLRFFKISIWIYEKSEIIGIYIRILCYFGKYCGTIRKKIEQSINLFLPCEIDNLVALSLVSPPI